MIASRRQLSFGLSYLLLVFTPTLSVGQTPRADGMLRLQSGDSVELIMSAPLRLATGVTGLGVQYHPFIAVTESPELKALATQLWRWLRPQIDSNPPPFVVLMATTGRAHPAPGVRQLQNFNYVVERRSDKKWYFSTDTLPLR